MYAVDAGVMCLSRSTHASRIRLVLGVAVDEAYSGSRCVAVGEAYRRIRLVLGVAVGEA